MVQVSAWFTPKNRLATITCHQAVAKMMMRAYGGLGASGGETVAGVGHLGRLGHAAHHLGKAQLTRAVGHLDRQPVLLGVRRSRHGRPPVSNC